MINSQRVDLCFVRKKHKNKLPLKFQERCNLEYQQQHLTEPETVE